MRGAGAVQIIQSCVCRRRSPSWSGGAGLFWVTINPDPVSVAQRLQAQIPCHAENLLGSLLLWGGPGTTQELEMVGVGPSARGWKDSIVRTLASLRFASPSLQSPWCWSWAGLGSTRGPCPVLLLVARRLEGDYRLLSEICREGARLQHTLPWMQRADRIVLKLFDM